MPDAFTCTVVTPEAEVFSGEVSYVAIPGVDGSLGVQSSHAPLLTQLGFGVLRLETVDAGTKSIFVGGGFAEVKDNKVTLLTNEAKPVDKLKRDEAQSALEEALELPSNTQAEQERKARQVDRARGMVSAIS